MTLVHYTIELCKLKFDPKLYSSPWKIAILVISPTARVGKQFYVYGDLIGYRGPAVGFVQHWYWIQLLRPIVFYVNK